MFWRENMYAAFDIALQDNWITALKGCERVALTINGVLSWGCTLHWGHCLAIRVLEQHDVSPIRLQQIALVLVGLQHALDDGLLYEQHALWLVRRYCSSLTATECQLLARQQMLLAQRLAYAIKSPCV